jgi:hypothetical protein
VLSCCGFSKRQESPTIRVGERIFYSAYSPAGTYSGRGAFVIYSLFAIIAFWFPITIVIVTAMSWIFWLIHAIRMKRA